MCARDVGRGRSWEWLSVLDGWVGWDRTNWKDRWFVDWSMVFGMERIDAGERFQLAGYGSYW